MRHLIQTRGNETRRNAADPYLPSQQLPALESCVTELRNEGSRTASFSYLYLDKYQYFLVIKDVENNDVSANIGCRPSALASRDVVAVD